MSSTLIRRQLVTYSLVSQQLGGTAHPVAALKPFFTPIAADWHGSRFDANAFRSELVKRYGLNISGDVTEIFVQQLHTLGMLKSVDQRAFEWVRGAATNDNGSEAEVRLNALLESAAKLHETKHDLLTKPFEEDQFLIGIQSVLLGQNKPLSSAVSAISDKSKVVDYQSPSDENLQHHEYFAAEYIRWCQENDPVTFDWLSDLAASTFVSEALIGIRTPNNGTSRNLDLTVYLDTPFAMALLGCSGQMAKEDALFIVETLKSLRVPVVIMMHSVEEMQGNLRAVLNANTWERRGASAAAMIHGETTEQYLDDVRQNPSFYLNEMGIKIVDASKLTHHVCKVSFSDDHRNNFYVKIYALNENDLARQRDVSSIEWMMYRRKGHSTRDVLRSKHILLTRNKGLVRLSQEFSLSDCGYQRGHVGPAISARDLAGVLWLMIGQKERVKLSQRQLLLSCDRARASAPEVVAAMLETVRAVNPKNADLIAAAMRRPSYLAFAMDAAANDGGRITEEVVESTLEAVRADLVAEERKRASNEIEEAKQKSESDNTIQRIVNRSLTKDRDTLAQTLLVGAKRRDDANRHLFTKTASRFRVYYYLSVSLVHATVIIIAGLAAIFGTDAVRFTWYWKAIAALFAAVVLLYGTHSVVHISIKRLVNAAATRAYRKEARKLFVTEDNPSFITEALLK